MRAVDPAEVIVHAIEFRLTERDRRLSYFWPLRRSATQQAAGWFGVYYRVVGVRVWRGRWNATGIVSSDFSPYVGTFEHMGKTWRDIRQEPGGSL